MFAVLVVVIVLTGMFVVPMRLVMVAVIIVPLRMLVGVSPMSG
jgi:hypothetical protein